MATATGAAVSPSDLADESLRRYVWKTAWALLRDENDASDVAQEALLRTLLYLKRRDPSRSTKLKYYVAVVARRLATDLLACRERIAGRRLKFSHADDQERYWASVADRREESPLGAASRHEDAARVNDAIDRLTDRQRRVVRGVYFEQTPQVEIADGSGLTKGAIFDAKRHALEQVRFHLQGSREVCHGCGKSFAVQYGRGSVQRYCTVTCRNRARGRRQIIRKAMASTAGDLS